MRDFHRFELTVREGEFYLNGARITEAVVRYTSEIREDEPPLVHVTFLPEQWSDDGSLAWPAELTE